MKTANRLLAVSLVCMGLWGCKGFKGATVTVNPNPLEVHADSIKFSVKATIAPKSGFKKGGNYSGEVAIKSAGGTYSLGTTSISQTKFPDIKKNGASVSMDIQKPFEDGMNPGKLVAIGKYERKKKVKDLPEMEIGQCCITTSRLVYENDQYLYLSQNHTYQKVVPYNLDARFQFPKNVFDLQPGEFEKSEIRQIGEFLTKRYVASSITIVGFASPEGPFKRNQFLSVSRSREVQKWLIEQLKKEGYNNYLDSTFFKISTTSEDWDGFLSNLRSMNFPEDVNSKIVEIVSAGYEEDIKEKKIMALVGGAKKVEEILAPLRRATIRLEGFEPRRTDAQIDSVVQAFLSGRNTQPLSAAFQKEEWVYAMSRVTDVEAKKKLLREFVKTYSDDYRILNDLGVYSLQENKVDEGFDYLTKANKAKPNDYVILNNLGVAYR
ncbi:MAG: hypothetical protein NZ108_04330, partial [Bacteroidia bacterium]|nr:hypothetical protein [Bacteroidia bacterium]